MNDQFNTRTMDPNARPFSDSYLLSPSELNLRSTTEAIIGGGDNYDIMSSSSGIGINNKNRSSDGTLGGGGNGNQWGGSRGDGNYATPYSTVPSMDMDRHQMHEQMKNMQMQMQVQMQQMQQMQQIQGRSSMHGGPMQQRQQQMMSVNAGGIGAENGNHPGARVGPHKRGGRRSRNGNNVYNGSIGNLPEMSAYSSEPSAPFLNPSNINNNMGRGSGGGGGMNGGGGVMMHPHSRRANNNGGGGSHGGGSRWQQHPHHQQHQGGNYNPQQQPPYRAQSDGVLMNVKSLEESSLVDIVFHAARKVLLESKHRSRAPSNSSIGSGEGINDPSSPSSAQSSSDLPSLKAVELANALRSRLGVHLLAHVRDVFGGLLTLLERRPEVFLVVRIPKNDHVILLDTSGGGTGGLGASAGASAAARAGSGADTGITNSLDLAVNHNNPTNPNRGVAANMRGGGYNVIHDDKPNGLLHPSSGSTSGAGGLRGESASFRDFAPLTAYSNPNLSLPSDMSAGAGIGVGPPAIPDPVALSSFSHDLPPGLSPMQSFDSFDTGVGGGGGGGNVLASVFSLASCSGSTGSASGSGSTVGGEPSLSSGLDDSGTDSSQLFNPSFYLGLVTGDTGLDDENERGKQQQTSLVAAVAGACPPPS
jgi:hypothetical protein